MLPGAPLLESDRFELRRRIGTGGFGVVYEAFDRQRGTVVALKMLHRLDAKGLYRFKQEFRSLSDIAHDNLITLHELLSHAGQWYFTMEFIEGGTILDYVWNVPGGAGAEAITPSRGASDGPTETIARVDQLTNQAEASSAHIVVHPSLTARLIASENIERLRDAVRGLAEGLSAIHRHGIVHQDVKPANVMVTPSGRVVLLDFGLAKNVAVDVTASTQVSGTPAYMSPEQASGRPLSEATDWYAVGVVMYQALTGRLPHSGPLLELFAAKQSTDPPAPATLMPQIPRELDDLCMDLLRRDPAGRPGVAEILRRLGGTVRSARPATAGGVPALTARLVGRERHLEQLRDAFRTSQGGRAVAVMIEGRSGMGKSSLVAELIRELNAAGPSQRKPVILQSRCYERETMPYKAVDGLIDALVRHLKGLSEVDAARLLPRDIHSLARLFPVLHQVDVIARTPIRGGDQADTTEMRRRAFVALRGLLGALADESPVIVSIDDIQWGDLDSVGLLRELLRPPTPPHMLLVLAFRSEERQTSPVVRALLEAFAELGAEQDVRTIEVGELSAAEAVELALSRLGSSDPAERRRAEAIALESGGSPFFVDELVRYAEAGGEQVELNELIRERIRNLPDESRQVLNLIAVSSRPVARDVVLMAAGTTGRHHATLDSLRVERLVKSHAAADRLELEPYHDRIREVTLARLTGDELVACHASLVRAWETDGQADPGTLTTHYQAIGDLAKTAHHAARAAADAERGLAFERAAYFYRLILQLGEGGTAALPECRVKLAEALANAGRGHEAGVEFLAIAEGQPPADAIRFEMRAAEQFLMGGSLDAGLDATARVLDRVGMKLPTTPHGLILSVLARRALLRMRGFKFKSRDESSVPASELQRLDVCTLLGGPLGMADPLQGFDLQVRQTLLALRVGEPHRVAWAMSNQICNFAISGSKTRAFTSRLIDDAIGLATRLDNRPALGRILVASGMACKLNGDFAQSLAFLDRAFETVENLPGQVWERQTARIFQLEGLMWVGRWVELFDRLPGFIEGARQRGDLYASTYMRSRYAPLGYLVADEPLRAREEADGVSGWSTRGYSLPRKFQLHSRVQASLYVGDPGTGWELLQAEWPMLLKTLMRSIQSQRIDAYQLRGRAAMAMMAATAGPEYLKAVIDVARALRRQRATWATGFADQLDGAVAAWRGDRATALALLVSSERVFAKAEMNGYLAATRRRRGEYLGGDEGRLLVETADAWFTEQRVKNPAALTNCFAPAMPRK